MSKKARALLTGEKTSEWNKYQIDMQEAYNKFQADQAAAQRKQKKKSGLSQLVGVVLFTAAAIATGGLTSIAAGGWKAAGTLAAGALAGAGGAWGAHEWQDDVTLGGSKEDYLTGISDPKFGKGIAAREKLKFEGEIQDDITALESYEEGGLHSALYENVGRASSYMPLGKPDKG